MKTPEELAEECKNKIAQRDIYAMGTLTQREQDYLKQAFLAGDQAAAPQWISVKERLPEAEQRVVIFDRGQFSVSYLTVWGHWAIEQQDVMKEPTYWMPLPKPPEDAKE